MGLLTELWAFMKERKKFWLLPVCRSRSTIYCPERLSCPWRHGIY